MDESEQNEAKGKYTLKKTFVLPIIQIEAVLDETFKKV